jgi:CheY-like chemotaxis protein/HPt (histidine-containing phosphotransfer) domain-containing protein
MELLRVICDAMHVTLDVSSPATQSESQDPNDRALSILVADDFADNRVIVGAYLNSTPHVLTFADDGRQAVDLFMNGRFDLVLMDVQMPVMDGLEATRVIRAFEADTGAPPTPIIAFTANARSEDVVASRMAGCNAHLAKPISKRALLAAVDQAAGDRFDQGKATHDEVQVEMPEGLEALAPPYLEARRHDMNDAERLLANGDFDALRILGHKMAGSGSSYGFAKLSELGAALEESGRAGDKGAVGECLVALTDYLHRVRLTKSRVDP